MHKKLEKSTGKMYHSVLTHLKMEYSGQIWLTQWLQKAWLLSLSSHQQPWYWLYAKEMLPWGANFNNQWRRGMIRHEVQISLHVFPTCFPRKIDTSKALTHWVRDKMATIYQTIFLNAFFWMKISIKISLKFVRNGPINNISTLDQIMAWHQ